MQLPTKEELTKEFQESIDCERAVLPNFKLEPPPMAAKRKRSAEEATTSANANVARNRITIGALDEGDPEGKIPRVQLKSVKAAPTNVELEVLLSNSGPPHSCTDARWYQGQIKMIVCDEKRSLQLFKATIAKFVEVYPGSKLGTMEWKDIPPGRNSAAHQSWQPESADRDSCPAKQTPMQ